MAFEPDDEDVAAILAQKHKKSQKVPVHAAMVTPQDEDEIDDGGEVEDSDFDDDSDGD